MAVCQERSTLTWQLSSLPLASPHWRLDTCALFALLDETRLVDGQDSFLLARARESFPELFVRQRIGLPRPAPGQVLEAVGHLQAGGLGELPAIFAL